MEEKSLPQFEDEIVDGYKCPFRSLYHLNVPWCTPCSLDFHDRPSLLLSYDDVPASLSLRTRDRNRKSTRRCSVSEHLTIFDHYLLYPRYERPRRRVRVRTSLYDVSRDDRRPRGPSLFHFRQGRT